MLLTAQPEALAALMSLTQSRSVRLVVEAIVEWKVPSSLVVQQGKLPGESVVVCRRVISPQPISDF
jgi:hypothetical protein